MKVGEGGLAVKQTVPKFDARDRPRCRDVRTHLGRLFLGPHNSQYSDWLAIISDGDHRPRLQLGEGGWPTPAATAQS